MSETARAMLELVVGRGWGDLAAEERALFEDWMLHAHGVDLYLLLRHAHRRWTRGASSSSQTLAELQALHRPSTPPPEDNHG